MSFLAKLEEKIDITHVCTAEMKQVLVSFARSQELY